MPCQVEIVPWPSVRLPDLCPEFVLPDVCPIYLLTEQVFAVSRTSVTFDYNSRFTSDGVTLVDLTCQKRRRPSNAAGDPLGSWSAWSNIHADFINDHPVTGRHTILQSVSAGTFWLVQIRLREDATPENWEIHPLCGDSAYHILTATQSDPGFITVL